MQLLAQATDAVTEVRQGYGGLIFTGLFFLTCLIVFAWWLKRQT